MANLKSIEEIEAYYDFCINQEIIATHNVLGHVSDDDYQTAVNDVCKYCNMDPADYPYEAQPTTERELSHWFGASCAIFWVLEDIIKEERE